MMQIKNMMQIKLQTRHGTSSGKINSILKQWSELENAYLNETFLKSRNAPHWHVTKNGTIEVTFLESKQTLLVKVREDRKGSWAGKSYKKLVKFLQINLSFKN